MKSFDIKDPVKPFIELDIRHLIIPPQEAKPIPGFEFPKHKETGATFPHCCNMHTTFYNNITDWFRTFPNCCTGHRKMAKQNRSYNKIIYAGTPARIAKQCAYTDYHINKQINNEDWFEDITEYIEYNVLCFGKPAIGLHIYLDYLQSNFESEKSNIPKWKRKQLLQVIGRYLNNENVNIEQTSLNDLFEIYQRWFKIFPFELDYFKHLKPRYEKTLPMFNGQVTINRYTGLASGKMHTKESLIKLLLERTNNILMHINTAVLLDYGELKNPDKLKLDLIIQERKLKVGENGSGYIKNPIKDDQQFRDILKEWYSDEKRFLDEITPLLSKATEVVIKSKSEILKEHLTRHKFLELPKVKVLSNDSKQKLLRLLTDNEMPYCIAMFEYLEFLQFLEKEYYKTKDKLHRGLSEFFDVDKSGRSIKGNISVLLAYSKEDKTRYTAHKYQETVIKDYEKLK